MLTLIRHRGPDDYGIEKTMVFNPEKEVQMGFVRLSIRDLSMNGHQPMIGGNGDIYLLFNGEIYNSDDIKSCLLDEGCTFHGTSDTEVILRAYENYGFEKMLSFLNGMFGIVVVDKRLDKIFMARDRMGEKPLYYYPTDDGLLFASEYKAFYAIPDFKPEMNQDAIKEFLMYNDLAGKETMLKDVYIVQPGRFIEYDGSTIVEKIYWDIPDNPANGGEYSTEVLAEQIRQSVKSRLVSDVEVGVELSGGIDSSLVTYYASEFNPKIKAYSIIFEDKNLSEEEYIDEVIKTTHCDSTKVILNNDDFLDSILKSTWNYEAPLHHYGSLQFYNMFKSVNLKVLLTGESADEIFGGYVWYPISMYYHKGDSFERDLASSWQTWMIDELDDVDTFLTFDTGISLIKFRKMLNDADYHTPLKRRRLIYEQTPGNGTYKRLNYETRTFMMGLLLRQDKMTMAHSIECRVPFTNHELISYVRKNIPMKDLVTPSFKYNPIENSKLTKKALKKVAEKNFSSHFAWRKKEGCHIPLNQYFYTENFKKFMEETILPGIRQRGIFNYNYIKECYDDKKNISDVLWRAVTFEIWAEIYLDNGGSKVLDPYYRIMKEAI